MHWEDRFSPFYNRVPDVPGVPIKLTANTVVAVAVGATLVAGWGHATPANGGVLSEQM